MPKLISDNDKCIRESKKEECKELELQLQKALTAVLGYAKDRFKLPVKNLREFDDTEEEKEKRESKKAEQKQKEAIGEEESRKKSI